MNVVEYFVAWFQQLPPAAQHELYAYIVRQVTGGQPPARPPRVLFGGSRSGPAPAPPAAAQRAVCPTCQRPVT